jgi:2-dehydro-3-deoxygluconokinase
VEDGADPAARHPGAQDRSADDSPAAEVVTLGECLVALVAKDHGPLAEASAFERHVAGAEANVAVGLARLGHRVAYVGRVGRDGFGTAILRRLRGEGVLTDFLAIDETAPTGLLVRERRSLGPAEVAYYRSGSAGARLSVADVEDAAEAGLFARARWLHVTGITPALSRSARAATERAVALGRESMLTVSLDVNLRRKLWSDDEAASTLRDLATKADVVLASGAEAALITGADPGAAAAELAEAILALGPSIAVIKLGAAGAVALEAAGQTATVSALPTSAVDTIGAGDGFSAGFIAPRLEGESLGRALEMANACGAAAVSVIGDLTGLPDRRELDRLLDVAHDDAIR